MQEFDQAFIALQSGEIMTFDVDRLCPSPYVIYNAWLDHQEVLNRTSESIEHRYDEQDASKIVADVSSVFWTSVCQL